MTSTWHRVPTLAKSLCISQHKMLDLIQSGELIAVNVATSTSTRAQWRISQEALDAFLAARQSRPPAPKPARQRRIKGGKEYV